MPRRLTRSFYRQDATTVARSLLGQKLVRVIDGKRLTGLIVETEAYLGVADKAAHSRNGRRTTRNESMWSEGGHAYVYFVYGMHHCLNVVAGRAGDPVAVLLRGLQPVEGLEQMRRRRGRTKLDTELCSGPGRLCQALAIDQSLDGVDLVASDILTIESYSNGTGRIGVGPRVGINYAEEWANRPLRFFVDANPHVSKS